MGTTLARLLDIHVFQQSTDAQVVGWTYIPVGGAPTTGATVQVERSYVQNDRFETLDAAVPASQGFYKDTSVMLHDQWRRVFYRLTLDDGINSPKLIGTYWIEYEVPGPARGLIRNTEALLRLGGVPVMIFQRVFDLDARCTCWDPVMGMVTSSSCTSCFGTGFTGGYNAPILTLAQIQPATKQSVPGDTLRQPRITAGLFSNYPILRPRDLVVEINKGRRYRVGSVATAEYGRILINQSTQLEALNPSDVEHQIDQPDPTTLTPLLRRVGPVEHRLLLSDNITSPISTPTLTVIDL